MTLIEPAAPAQLDPAQATPEFWVSLLAPTPLMPVVVVERVADAVKLASLLVKYRISSMEITLRTASAHEAIREVSRAFPKLAVGAGTVCSPQLMDQAQADGACFVVSPGATQTLVSHAAACQMPFLPGAATASEVMQAMAWGFAVLKFFPAAYAGGIPLLKAFAGPFPDVQFIPTGGITAANAGDYLVQSNVLGVGASWVVDAQLIRASRWAEIESRLRAATSLMAPHED